MVSIIHLIPAHRSFWALCLELLVLLGGILVSALACCLVQRHNWRFPGGKPSSATSEARVPIAPESMPWQTDKDGNKDFKYQYHPGGDTSKPLKEAPSALNVVIVPDVNLPKVKSLKPSQKPTNVHSGYMTSSTNGARMAIRMNRIEVVNILIKRWMRMKCSLVRDTFSHINMLFAQFLSIIV